MSTPETLRWWSDQIRKCTSEFYFSHVLVADLNYAADEIEKLQAENAKLREHIADLWEFGFSKNAGANSIKEYLRKVDELRDRTYELLGVTA